MCGGGLTQTALKNTEPGHAALDHAPGKRMKPGVDTGSWLANQAVGDTWATLSDVLRGRGANHHPSLGARAETRRQRSKKRSPATCESATASVAKHENNIHCGLTGRSPAEPVGLALKPKRSKPPEGRGATASALRFLGSMPWPETRQGVPGRRGSSPCFDPAMRGEAESEGV